MKKKLDGRALVFCEGAFNTPEGKTAHGLVRFTERYEVLGVIDSNYACFYQLLFYMHNRYEH